MGICGKIIFMFNEFFYLSAGCKVCSFHRRFDGLLTEVTQMLLELQFASFKFMFVWSGIWLVVGALFRIVRSKSNILLFMVGLEMFMFSIIYLLILPLVCVVGSELKLVLSYTNAVVLLTLVVMESVLGLTLVVMVSRTLASIELESLNRLRG